MVSLLNPPPLCGECSVSVCSEQCNIVVKVHQHSTLGLVCEEAWFDWQTGFYGVSNKVRIRKSADAYLPFTSCVAEQKYEIFFFSFVCEVDVLLSWFEKKKCFKSYLYASTGKVKYH